MMNNDDVCLCPEMPVNIWFRDGEEVHRRTLTEVPGAAHDAAQYLAMGCDGWAIECPTCGRSYGKGQRGWWVLTSEANE